MERSVELFCGIWREDVRSNEFTLATVLKGCSLSFGFRVWEINTCRGNGEAVLRLFCKIEDPEMSFSNYTLSIVLKEIASSSSFRVGQAVHSMVIKVGGELNDFVRCSLVNMYSKCGVAYDALTVFKTMKNPDIVAWSSVISVLDQQGLTKEAASFA
ncbi:hypothetical protein DH2020_046641 [Rehmannia glutinosa]|uniref:Pentatricopeptide repeat-containing protein n=1 Tax=Rehmannia glutinosa TaxID=99300 RepID=A0ABR0UAQ7_REHGL